MTSAISCFIRRCVLGLVDLAGTQRGARLADRRGLRVRPDRGGRQRRQVQPCLLAGAALGRVAPVRAGRDDRVDAGPDLVVVQPRVLLAGGHGGVGGRDLVGDRFASLVQCAGKSHHLGTFSCPNASQLRRCIVQVGFGFQRVRHVQG